MSLWESSSINEAISKWTQIILVKLHEILRNNLNHFNLHNPPTAKHFHLAINHVETIYYFLTKY